MKKMTTEYENPWLWEGKPFTQEMVQKYAGFIYLLIDRVTGKKYIGKKYFDQVRKVKKKTRRVRSSSNWMDYYSSSETVKKLVEEHGIERFERHILSLHITRGSVNREEIRLQFALNVLEGDEYLNDCIGKYRRETQRIIEGKVFSKINPLV